MTLSRGFAHFQIAGEVLRKVSCARELFDSRKDVNFNEKISRVESALSKVLFSNKKFYLIIRIYRAPLKHFQKYFVVYFSSTKNHEFRPRFILVYCGLFFFHKKPRNIKIDHEKKFLVVFVFVVYF